MSTAAEGTVLWQPSEALQQGSVMRDFMRWLAEHKGLRFEEYPALWEWSAANPGPFWEALWRFWDVKSSAPYTAPLEHPQMPGARWFSGARLNYAEHVFRNASADRPALIYESELRPLGEVSWAELERQVASIAASLRAMGVQPGDRVVGYIPNIPEAVAAFLAAASLGAIWSSCSPDMGSASVVDRFKQIEPKVLFAVDGYRYNGKDFDRRETVRELQAALPTLEHTVLVPYLNPDAQVSELGPSALPWSDLLTNEAPPSFEQVAFEHPLWVLYSSGTTGLPKPIVQGHGGILLEHFKHLALHIDLRPEDHFFWFTTTGWMMWNLLIGGLLVGSTVLLYDGSPARENMGALWSFAERAGTTYFGASAAYIASCMKSGVEPATQYDLSRIRGMGSTGSPLSVEGFQWVYEQVKPDVWLASMSGGTDVCTAFVGASPLLPVRAGEIQCRCLGTAVAAFDEEGQPVMNEVGELVITQPMPSMPLYFWNDPDGTRYRESYFEMFPGVWRHGDWVRITPNGGVVIYGRSDATINRQGIRMGTSEIYRVVEDIPEVLDSLVVDLEYLGRLSFMPLFVVLQPGLTLDEALTVKIKDRIRAVLSARYVPNAIYQIDEVPRTLSGKKLELPIKKILLGQPATKVANPDAMANPQTIAYFAALAQTL
ncbi:MAG TPA: acetoacetate--CoA ligase [Ktedonobacterales bacterium]